MDKAEYAELLAIVGREITELSITVDILNSKLDLFGKMANDQLGDE
jgi:hypothetical protein